MQKKNSFQAENNKVAIYFFQMCLHQPSLKKKKNAQ